jgi:hypothetical protein
MKKGLIRKYQRSGTGTLLAVHGDLWKHRSLYFKQSLLKEIYVYNKVHDYAVATQIVDSISGRLYAQISPAAKMDFYD